MISLDRLMGEQRRSNFEAEHLDLALMTNSNLVDA
jgi:hypothetical protein